MPQILEKDTSVRFPHLTVLKASAGSGERRGEERNFQRYLDRVADMKAGIARTESDIAALKREMTKLAP